MLQIAQALGVLQVEIAAAGGILPLVKRLAMPCAIAQANAAGALWSLAQDLDNQVSPCADNYSFLRRCLQASLHEAPCLTDIVPLSYTPIFNVDSTSVCRPDTKAMLDQLLAKQGTAAS